MATDPNGFGYGGTTVDPYSTGYNGGIYNGVAGGTNGTDPMSGFASQYNPTNLGSVIYDSPWAILPQVFSGLSPASVGYQALRDFGADPLTLFNIIAGQNSDLTSAGVGGYANWLADLYNQIGRAGGRAFNSRELLNAISNPSEGSALYNIMASGDANTRARTLYNLIREATNAGMNPLAARGYQAMASNNLDTYLNNFIRSGGSQPTNASVLPVQWLQQRGMGL